MTVEEVFLQVKDYGNLLLSNPCGMVSGRMNSAGSEFYRLLGLLTDYFLSSENIQGGVLKFIAKPENLESFGPIIDHIQPREHCKEVQYRIAVALTADIDLLVEKEKKYQQLGLNDTESLASYRRLEKYLEDYFSR